MTLGIGYLNQHGYCSSYTCPFHGWTFNNSGKPQRTSTSRSSLGLQPEFPLGLPASFG